MKELRESYELFHEISIGNGRHEIIPCSAVHPVDKHQIAAMEFSLMELYGFS